VKLVKVEIDEKLRYILRWPGNFFWAWEVRHSRPRLTLYEDWDLDLGMGSVVVTSRGRIR
jgi:hypothetical protein